MAAPRTYCVVLPLAPLAVGTWIDRSAWPLHLTLVPDVRSEADLDVLVAVVRRAALHLPALSTTVGAEAWFGPDESILVDLAGRSDLLPAHEALLDALEEHADAVPLVGAYHRAGYRPHVTATSQERATCGDLLSFGAIALVELGADDRATLAAPLALFELAATSPPPVPTSMEAEAAVALLASLGAAGVNPWVIGGWGVDALVGEATRSHHDLDVLVDVAELPALLAALPSAGMTVRWVWSENRWIGETHLPSAFVADGARGELDVHVVRVEPDGPVPLSESRIALPRDALDTTGTVGGLPVRCASVEAQLVMHRGYELSEPHAADVARLRSLRS